MKDRRPVAPAVGLPTGIADRLRSGKASMENLAQTIIFSHSMIIIAQTIKYLIQKLNLMIFFSNEHLEVQLFPPGFP